MAILTSDQLTEIRQRLQSSNQASVSAVKGQINPSASNWKGTGNETAGASAGTSGTVKNNAIITIGSAATSGPTSVVGFAVLDSCTIGAGNVLFYAALTANKTINNGDPAPTFAVDALTVQDDN